MIEWLLNQTLTVKWALALMAYLIVHFIIFYFSFDSRRKRALNKGKQIKLVETKQGDSIDFQKRHQLLCALAQNPDGKKFLTEFIQKRVTHGNNQGDKELLIELFLESGFGRTNIPTPEIEKLIQCGEVNVAIILLLNSYFDHQSANFLYKY